ncbi:MAG: hypothetical protein AB1744_10285, partial [Candidatus Zixiibacteriota bacterium]
LGIIPNRRWDQTATISASLSKVDFVDLRLSLGVEYSFSGLVHIRGGLRGKRPSVGGGLTYKSFEFDYALVDRDLGSIHMFTLTTAFGKPTGERRRIRELRREAEFNSMMSQHLADRNREMIDQLMTRGEDLLSAGELAEAGSQFDRALFLARGSGADTAKIYHLAMETRERLVIADREMRFEQFMDSARTRFADCDYLAARYFANLALAESPTSADAAGLLKQTDEAIQESIARDELIQNRLWVVDSLLSYGRVDRALSIIRSLSEYAPEHGGVVLALKRVEFERYRRGASTAYAERNFQAALAALDSASVLFPEHQWCVDLRERIEKELSEAQRHAPTVVSAPAPEPLSPQLQKEVDAAYRSAQEAFQKGELAKAIADWEKVERLAPDYLSVRRYLVSAYKFVGVELYGQNRFQEAVATWKKAAELDPENSELNNYIKRTESEIQKLRELSYEQWQER